MFYFYAIKSQRNGTIYKGISINPYFRLKQHNAGKNFSTKPHRPYEIVYLEKCRDRTKAREREKFYKSGSGREKLKKLIGNKPEW
ncbi:GIY-YIG nuclease family protein [Patescibacteria group bacterium]|nr:GIY-YIG nuclease family protein [Patescibacteria group bacterium]